MPLTCASGGDDELIFARDEATHLVTLPQAMSGRYLLIDISNSFTKLAFATRARVSRPKRVATSELGVPYLRRMLKNRKIDRIVVSSVVPAKNRIVRTAARRTPMLHIGPRVKLGVGIDYPSPQTIGADRLANAA